MRAAGYVRVSTQEQADNGWNLAEDRRLIEERCASEGWELVAIHDDGGRQGDDPDRPGLRALIDSLGDLDVVILRSQDRISRDLGIWAVTSAALRAAKVRVVTFSGEIDLESPAGEFMANVMASVGKFEKRQTGQRVRQALHARARAGKYNGGRVLGYRQLDGMGLGVVDAEAAIVRRIFSEFVSGRAVARIARGLHEDRIATRAGGRWYPSTVKAVLANPLYAGLVRTESGTSQGEHEAIIDPETWAKAEQLRVGRVTYGGRPKGRKAIGAHLLTEGMLRCSCGAPMTPETRRYRHHEYQHYICSRAKLHRVECPQRRIRREIVDSAIYDFFESVVHDEEATRRGFRDRVSRDLAAAEALLEQAESEVAKSDARLARVKRGWQDETIDDAEYAQQRAELVAERSAALAQVEQHRRRLSTAQGAIDALDAELEVGRRLTEIRRAVCGEIAGNRADLDALRATLRRLFAGFVLLDPDRPSPPLPAAWGACWKAWEDHGDHMALGPYVRTDALTVDGLPDDGEFVPIDALAVTLAQAELSLTSNDIHPTAVVTAAKPRA